MSGETGTDNRPATTPAIARKLNIFRTILLFLAATVIVTAATGLFYLAISYKPYTIPQGAMIPTLAPGDRMYAERAYYQSHEIRRGEIATFRQPGREQIIIVMRVVGLAGDRIQIRNGILHVNDKAVERRRVEDDTAGDYPGSDNPDAGSYVETLPNGSRYRIVEALGDAAPLDNTPVYDVPPGNVFVLGDNRDNSADSRYMGFVPVENLLDRPSYIFWSTDRGRIGMRVR